VEVSDFERKPDPDGVPMKGHFDYAEWMATDGATLTPEEEAEPEEPDEEPEPVEHDEDDPYPDRVMVDAQGRPHYEP
jgi:hypothetical protein